MRMRGSCPRKHSTRWGTKSLQALGQQGTGSTRNGQDPEKRDQESEGKDQMTTHSRQRGTLQVALGIPRVYRLWAVSQGARHRKRLRSSRLGAESQTSCWGGSEIREDLRRQAQGQRRLRHAGFMLPTQGSQHLPDGNKFGLRIWSRIELIV